MNTVETRHPLVPISLQQPLNQRDPTSSRGKREENENESEQRTMTRGMREKGKARPEMKSKLFFSFFLSPLFSSSRYTRIHTYVYMYNGSNGWKIPSNAKTPVTREEKNEEGKEKGGKKPRVERLERFLSFFFSLSLFPFFPLSPAFCRPTETRYVTTPWNPDHGLFCSSLDCVSSQECSPNPRITRLERTNGACTRLRTGCEL